VTVDVDQRPPRRSRFLYPAFIASLALNLLFIGGIAAAAWHHHHSDRLKAREAGLLGFVKELSADRQQPVRDEITAARESLKDQRAAVRKEWIATNDLLTTEPFDKEKFKASMAQLRDVENQYKTGLNNALAETAAKLSPDERKLLKSWRETRRPWLLRRSKEHSGSSSKSD
jgi:uncharacterized membrane protein